MTNLIRSKFPLSESEMVLSAVARVFHRGGYVLLCINAHPDGSTASFYDPTADEVIEYHLAGIGPTTVRSALEATQGESTRYRFWWAEEESASEAYGSVEELRAAWPGLGAVLQRQRVLRWENVT